MKATVILVLALVGHASASAQAPNEQGARDAAIDLALEAQAHFDAGRVDETIEALLRARSLYPEPLLLYNLGRAYEAKGQEADALEAYRAYLRDLPDGPNAASLRARVTSIEASIADRERLESERAEEERRRREEQRRRVEAEERVTRISPAAWVVLGVGAAALAVGGGLGGAAISRREEANDSPSHAEAVSGFERAETLATSSTVLLIGGGVIAAAGLTWVIVSASRRNENAQASVSLGPGTVQFQQNW